MLGMKNKITYENSSNSLVRKSGLFYKRQIHLDKVREILAINKDSLTHDEVMLCFLEESGSKFFISEFDKNFKECLEELAGQFPGIQQWDENLTESTFANTSKTLWKAKNLNATYHHGAKKNVPLR